VPADATAIWSKAKPILLPYEGSASQLYVLDVPVSECGAVVDLFASFVERPELLTLDNYWDEPRPLTAEMRSQLLSHTDKSTTHQLRGVHAGRENVSLFLWLDSNSRTFDAELVFWSDQLFPQPDQDGACIQTLQPYIHLAERIREHSPASECVLSASETGDPRDDRNKPWTCWW
jgi:hypothetical protein